MTYRLSVTRRFALGITLVGLVMVAVPGCSTAEPVEASVWDMPEVVWDGGAAPSGGAEDSPWAKEYRAARLIRSYAWARKDTSYAEYVATFGYDAALKSAESMAVGYNDLLDHDPETGDYVWNAPARWAAQRILITGVTEDPDGRSAVLDECYVIYESWSFDEEVNCVAARLTHNDDGTISIELATTPERPLEPGASAPAEEPTVDEIPTARWATPITTSTLPGEAKMPPPRDYYVDLGVISQ